MKKIIFIILIALAWRHFYYTPSAPSYGEGVYAGSPPYQEAPSKSPFEHHGAKISPKANFSVNARVLSAEHYYFDSHSDLSPIDLVLGWGRMSDETVTNQIEFSQGNRSYSWETESLPIPKLEIEEGSANVHIVPATNEIEKQLSTVQIGQIVSLEGWLVDIKSLRGGTWKSSLTRTDTGEGASEVFYVNRLNIINPFTGDYE
ncbi:MAG: hypothetical protein GXO35_08405 [Gammaproteobacteria bacterium]|nr:hypothetical protein [Gammaproteobacteria bacterium]